MGYESLLFDVEDGVATITLNRPARHNAFNRAMAFELRDAWESVKRDSAIVCAIVTGAGDKAFCTGMDVADVAAGTGQAEGENERATSPFFHLTAIHNKCWKPVITAVNGMVVGGGLHFIADSVGMKITRWEEDIEPVHAKRDLKSGLGPVKKGAICGVRQEARGYDGKWLKIELKFQASIGFEDPHDRVIVTGVPPIDLVWRGGVHGDIATSAITLNSIPALRKSAPGLHTMATIPLVGCAAPERK